MKIDRTRIVGMILGLIVVLLIVTMMYNGLKDSPIKCDEYEQVKYRSIGNGGIFGGINKVEVYGDQYDGFMNKCIKGMNLFGEKI